MQFCERSPFLLNSMSDDAAQHVNVINSRKSRVFEDLIEHVLVVGLPDKSVEIPSKGRSPSVDPSHQGASINGEATVTIEASSGSTGAPLYKQRAQEEGLRGSASCSLIFHPEILYQFPEGKDIEFGCIADFCMPSGAKVQAYPEKDIPGPPPTLTLAASTLKQIQQKWKAQTTQDAHNRQDWRSFLHKYDANRNGMIESDEFKMLLRKGLRITRVIISDVQISTLFRELDTEGTQSLSLDQIQSLLEYSSVRTECKASSFPPGSQSLGASKVEPPHREYVFRLTGGGRDGADVYYGICLHTTVPHHHTHLDGIVDKRADMQRCICIITRYPFLDFFFNVLRDLARTCEGNIQRSMIDDIVKSYVEWPVPASGTTKSFQPLNGTEPFELTRPPSPSKEELHGLPEEIVFVREWALPILFSSMTIDNVMMVLGCAMREMHVVVETEDLQLLSGVIWSVVCLLHPLKWANPLIVTVPNTLYEFLDSPIPPLLGVEKLPNSFVFKPGMLIVRPEKNVVLLHDEDMQRYHTLCLPQVSRLCHDLRGHERVLRGPGGLVPPVMQNLHLDLKRSSSPAWGPTPPSAQQEAAFTAIVDGIYSHQIKLLEAALHLDAEIIREKLEDTPALQIDGMAWQANGTNNNGNCTKVVDNGIEGISKNVIRKEYPAQAMKKNKGTKDGLVGDSKTSWWKELLGDAGREFMTRVLESQMIEVYSFEPAAQKHVALHRGKILAETRRLLWHMDQSRMELVNDLPPITASLVRNGAFFDLFHVILTRGELPDLHHKGTPSSLTETTEVKENDGDGDSRKVAPVLWCNGMCGGKMNTPLCTAICLQHWQNRYEHRLERELFRKAATIGIMNFNEDAGKQIPRKPHAAETPSQWRRARWRRRSHTTVPRPDIVVKKAKRQIVKKRIAQNRRLLEKQLLRSAVRLQSATRGLLERRLLERKRDSAILIQAQWREVKMSGRWRALRPLRLKIAARIIQTAIRRYLERPVSRLTYMELVSKVEKSAALFAANQRTSSPQDYGPRSSRNMMFSLTDVALKNIVSPLERSPEQVEKSPSTGSIVQDQIRRFESSTKSASKTSNKKMNNRRPTVYSDASAMESTAEAVSVVDSSPPRSVAGPGYDESFFDAVDDEYTVGANTEYDDNVDLTSSERDEARLAAFKRILLRPGVIVVKHGRYGTKKRRMLNCDEDFTVLLWNEEEPPKREGAWKYVRRRMSSGRANRSIPFVDIIGASVRTDLKIESRRRRSSNISIPSAKQSRIPSETDSHPATPSGESYRNSQLDTESVAQGSTFATEHGSDVSSDAGMSRRQRRGSFFTNPKYAVSPDELGYAFTVHTRRKNLELELGDELLMKRLVDGFNLLAREVRMGAAIRHSEKSVNP